VLKRVRTLYHHWIIDLETGKRLPPPKPSEPRNAHSRQRAPASAALRGQSSSLGQGDFGFTPLAIPKFARIHQ
jgi:hypothetical protein